MLDSSNIARLRQLTGNADSIDFLNYCLGCREDSELPVFERFNPFDLPTFVPNMFIIDLREGYDSGLLLKFSGTLIDGYFGRNIQGMKLEDLYRGDPDRMDMISRYHRCAERREVYFRQRDSEYEFRIRGLERGAQDMIIVPMTSNKHPDKGIGDPPKVSFLCGVASFAIKSGVTQTVEEFLPLADRVD